MGQNECFINLKEEITTYMNLKTNGAVFFIENFLSLAEYDAIRKTRIRLNDTKLIRRILPGIYDKPYFSTITNEYTAIDFNQLVYALARKFNWTVSPNGALAANLLGLSTQIPFDYSFCV